MTDFNDVVNVHDEKIRVAMDVPVLQLGRSDTEVTDEWFAEWKAKWDEIVELELQSCTKELVAEMKEKGFPLTYETAREILQKTSEKFAEYLMGQSRTTS